MFSKTACTCLLAIGFSLAVKVPAVAQKPKIAVFSGPTATIQNSEALVTSDKARAKYGLPQLTYADGTPVRFDALRPQRLAAPVTSAAFPAKLNLRSDVFMGPVFITRFRRWHRKLLAIPDPGGCREGTSLRGGTSRMRC